MLALGTKAPAFALTDVTTQNLVTLDRVSDKKATLVMFIANHCPYVQHVLPELVRIGKEYEHSDLGIVAISSNDAEAYPEDSPEKMRLEAENHGFAFPYLFDEDQDVAAAYTAVCTPDFFLFDDELKLVYRGRLDESRPRTDVPVTGRDLRDAIRSALGGGDPADTQFPSMGCSIKWKPGSEPEYLVS